MTPAIWRLFAAVAAVVRMSRIEAAVGSYLASGRGEREGVKRHGR